MTIARLLLVAALAPTTVARAQSDPVAESRAHYRAAVQAYQARDLQAFLDHARQAQALRPAHGGVTYALASAFALTGDTAGALATLRHFALLGYSADLAADSDFARLRGNEAYAELTRRLERNGEPVVASQVVFELPERDLLTEGIAHDARDDVFYVGSVHQSKIFRVTRAGSVSEFTPELPGRWAPLGLRVVDRKGGALWVAAAALPQTAGYDPSDSGRSAILRYDLQSGHLSARYDAPTDGTPHLIGDLIVTRGGDVYATDSRAPVLYRVAARGDSLERFVESPLLLSGQGLALTPDERSLYVADYARGILRVDLRERNVSLVEAADSVLALGIDGLYFHQGGLVGIQNGVTPHRVARFTLGPAGDRVLRAEVLERAHPRYDEPTLGVLVDGELYYIANAQWERFGEDGRIAKPEALKMPAVLRLRF
jgi:sugar lactone lactonase YvrE